MTAYARLTDRFARIATVGEASSMLGWDAAAMMPPGGGAARGDQLAVLAGLAHGLLTAPETADDLAQAHAQTEAGSDEWALRDGVQRGIGAADVAPVCARYEAFLRDALPRAEERQARQPPPVPLPGVFPAERQEGLCRHLSARAGLEAEHARLDRSTHPFCGGTPTDVRITTRYDESDPAQALMGVLHETGHALYERGLPAARARQPVGEAAGMAAHESQSLIVEMQSCRSDPFLAWLGPQMHGIFGGPAEPYAPANLSRLWRRVGRGFIRVDADEMTYPAHVILRFRLEQALVSGDLAVADLPGAWRDGMASLLGTAPPDDARGCLQDIHWYDGAFGYFPSYTLGAMAAAQLMAAARRDVADLDAGLGRGELGPLVGWLRLHVHGQGSRLGFNDLLRAATGKPLTDDELLLITGYPRQLALLFPGHLPPAG